MAEPKLQLFEPKLQDMAQLFKALGHPARLQILKFLASHNACFSGNIADEVPLGRTTVNQHLNELKKAGLIKGIVSGSKTNYCINKEVFKNFGENVVEFLDSLDGTKCMDC